MKSKGQENVGFNQGLGSETGENIKKKMGRRSVKKANKIARKTGVEGLWENKKGISDVYKEFYEEISDSNGVFRFGYAAEEEEVGKKGWVKAIIKSEQPDIVGLQETKCNLVDDSWVEDVWGGNGDGMSQIPAVGNTVERVYGIRWS
ncbi:RNA-directed DNA polymerase, eukaryota [Tanacetum coccineum]